MRTLKPLLSTLAVLAGGLLLSAAPALATNYGYREAGVFGPEGPGALSTPFSNPVGVAVDNTCAVSKLSGPACTTFDPSNEDVYIADRGAQTVSKFTPAGEPISTLTLPEGAIPGSVAVDPTSGDVYLLAFILVEFKEGSSYRPFLEKFTPTGEQVAGFTLTGPELKGPNSLAVDPRNGDLYIACGAGGPVFHVEKAEKISGTEVTIESGVVDQFTSSGAYVSQITSERKTETEAPNGEHQIQVFSQVFVPADVAVDSAGNVYVADGGSGHSGGLDETGVDKYSFVGGAWAFDGVVDHGQGAVFRLAADPVTGGIFTPIFQNDNSSHLSLGVDAYSSSEGLLYNFGSNNGFGKNSAGETLSGVTVNASTGTVYVSNDRASRVDIFDRTPLAAPSVTGLAPSNLLPQSAVLNGSIDPNGIATSYHFEYWTTPISYHLHTAAVEAGAGFASKPIATVLTGIEPHTTYHTVLVATNAEGTNTGQEQTFTTGALPGPEASTGAAGEITPYTATIAGTLNTNGIVTSYHFDIGSDTNYGAQVFGSGIFAQATPITLALQNLQPGTTYHYRFVASNPVGAVYGQDQTFTTAGVPQAITAAYIPPLIAVPNINFPKAAQGGTSKPQTRAQKYSAALKSCKKDRSKAKRAKCEKAAKKKFGPVKKAKGKKK